MDFKTIFGAAILAVAFCIPTIITAQQTEDQIIPYQNGDRIEKSQVRDALNYYDIVFFSGDNIRGLESLAGTMGRIDGINAVALTGWNAPECTIILSASNIEQPSVGATFSQGSVDRGVAYNYARELVGVENVFFATGNCVNDHPPAPANE